MYFKVLSLSTFVLMDDFLFQTKLLTIYFDWLKKMYVDSIW